MDTAGTNSAINMAQRNLEHNINLVLVNVSTMLAGCLVSILRSWLSFCLCSSKTWLKKEKKATIHQVQSRSMVGGLSASFLVIDPPVSLGVPLRGVLPEPLPLAAPP